MNRKITRRILVLLLLLAAHCSLLTAQGQELNDVRSGAAKPSRCVPGRNNIFYWVGHGWQRCTATDIWTEIPASEVLNGLNPRATSGQVFDVKAYGAVGDAVEITDAAITSGQPTLTSAGSSFPTTVVGKSVSVRGAGASGATLRASVIARPSATTLTLSVNASATVTREQAVYGVNDVAAFLLARDAAKAAGGGTIYIPAGFYYLNNQIPVDGTVAFKGDGWNERSTLGIAPTAGTRLYVGFDTSTADSVFYVTVQGVEIENLEFYATQKEGTPLTTPWAIHAYRNPSFLAGGDGVKIRRVMIRNLSHGIKVLADRPVLDDIYGQPLTLGIYLDGIYDSPKINNVHFWPFWAGTMSGYTLANATALKMGRVDGPQITNFFCYAYYKGIDFEDSAAGISQPGSTARAQLVNAYLDNVHYGIHAGGGIDAVATNLVIYNGSGLGNATTGSRGIYLKSGIVARLQITNGDFMGSDLEAIRVDSAAGTIGWSNVWVRNWNALNNGSNAFYGVSGNTVTPGATTADPAIGHGASVFGGTWTLVGVRTPTGATGFAGLGTLTPLNLFQIRGAAVGLETTPDWQLRVSKNFSAVNGLGAGPGILLAHQADDSFGGVGDAVNLKRAGIASPAEDDTYSKAVGLGFWTSATDKAFSEKVRITGSGNLGIGTTVPTSKLQVVGLPVFANNAAAIAGGLTQGAFY